MRLTGTPTGRVHRQKIFQGRRNRQQQQILKFYMPSMRKLRDYLIAFNGIYWVRGCDRRSNERKTIIFTGRQHITSSFSNSNDVAARHMLPV